MRRSVALLKETFSEWNSHEAPRMGAALAFYSILSLAPLLVLVVGMCALVFGTTGAQTQLLEQFRVMVGEEGARAKINMVITEGRMFRKPALEATLRSAEAAARK